jgi:hypothetical protein
MSEKDLNALFVDTGQTLSEEKTDDALSRIAISAVNAEAA